MMVSLETKDSKANNDFQVLIQYVDMVTEREHLYTHTHKVNENIMIHDVFDAIYAWRIITRKPS